MRLSTVATFSRTSYETLTGESVTGTHTLPARPLHLDELGLKDGTTFLTPLYGYRDPSTPDGAILGVAYCHADGAAVLGFDRQTTTTEEMALR